MDFSWPWTSFNPTLNRLHIGALWTEGPFEKFQFYVLPMKNLFFFPGISNLQNDILDLHVALAKKIVHMFEKSMKIMSTISFF